MQYNIQMVTIVTDKMADLDKPVNLDKLRKFKLKICSLEKIIDEKDATIQNQKRIIAEKSLMLKRKEEESGIKKSLQGGQKNMEMNNL